MRILLVAPGAEDCRRPAWGHIRRALEGLGHLVVCIDQIDMKRLSAASSVQQWKWVVATHRPEHIIFVASDETHDQDLLKSGANVPLTILNVPEISTWSPQGAVQVAVATSATTTSQEQRSNCFVAFADHSSAGESALRSCLQANLKVEVFGVGWPVDLVTQGRIRGPIPYAEIGPHMGSAKAVLILPGPGNSVGPLQAEADAGASHTPAIIWNGPETLEVLLAFAGATAPEEPGLTWEDQLRALLPSRPPVVTVSSGGPRVSFVTAAYNIERYIGPALESMLSQTFDDLEVIVVDDGSTDSTASVIDKYSGNPKLRVIKQENIGQTGRMDWVFARTTPEARGEYIAWLGGDDVAFPDRIAKQVELLDSDVSADVVHTEAVSLDGFGNFGQALFPSPSYDNTSLLRELITVNAVASPTVTLRRRVFERFGNWTGGFAQDYHLWLEVARRGQMRFIPEALTAYRVHESNSSTGANMHRGLDEGLFVRNQALTRLSLLDLYPALDGVDDHAATAAACVDLGNRLLVRMPDPASALVWFDIALAELPEAAQAIHLNRAVALLLLGDSEQASYALEKSDFVSATSQAPSIYEIGMHHLRGAEQLSTKPFTLSADLARQTTCWDGTSAEQIRLLCLPNWQHPQSLSPVIESFVETFSASDSIDLVIPTLGLAQDQALQLFAAAIPHGVDLSQAAALTLEAWDHPNMIPTARFGATIDLRNGLDVAGQGQWLQQLNEIRNRSFTAKN